MALDGLLEGCPGTVLNGKCAYRCGAEISLIPLRRRCCSWQRFVEVAMRHFYNSAFVNILRYVFQQGRGLPRRC